MGAEVKGGEMTPMGWTRSNRDGVAKYLDPLGLFNRPDYPKRVAFEEPMYNQAKAMEAEAGQFAHGARGYISDIMDTTDEQQRFAGTSSADSWQALKGGADYDSTRPGLSSFARAMAAASARSKIASMGREAVESQAVRDRIGVMKAGMGLRTGNIRDLGTLVAGNDAMNAANMQAQQMKQSAWQGAAGTVAGAFGGWMANRGAPSASGEALRQQMVKTGMEKV